MRLARFFGLASEPDDEPAAEAPALSSRERLDQAHAALANRKVELEDAVSRRKRVRAVIDAEAPAREAAESAVQEATEHAKRCALSGATGPSGDQAALDAAADAQRRALQAALRADGARAALSEVMADESAARMALRSAQEAVEAAAADVTFDEQAVPDAQLLVELAAEYREVLNRLLPHAVLRRPLWCSSHPYSGFANGHGGELLAQAFAESRVFIPSDDQLRNGVDQFVDLRRVDELKRAIRSLAAGSK
jgi:hypothetical protein